MNKNNFIQSALVGASVAVVFVVIITVAGELYQTLGADGKLINPIKDLLKSLHGHHWVGKGIWATILFLVSTASMYLLIRKSKNEPLLNFYVSLLSYTLIIGTFALFGFFTYEYLINH